MSVISDAPTLSLDFRMTETVPISEITDSALGNTLSDGAGDCTLAAGGAPGVTVAAYNSTGTLAENVATIGDLDWMMMTAFTSVSGGAGSYDNGSGNFYLSHIRLQPYVVSFFDQTASAETQIATPIVPDLLRRTEGQTYVIAAVKRGSVLEHWVDGVLMGSVDTNLLLQSIALETDSTRLAKLQSLYNNWHDLTLGKVISFGHSAYDVLPTCYDENGDPPVGFDAGSTGIWYPHLSESATFPGYYEVPGGWYQYDTYTGAVLDLAQDYLFARLFVFPSGANNYIDQAMIWMKEQALLGNKQIWPGIDTTLLQTTQISTEKDSPI